MIKRILLALAIGLALYLGFRAARRALASETTQITWVMDELCAGFAATRMNPVMAALAPEFFEEALGADREMVKLGLAHLFFEQRGGEDRRFPYRVTWRSEKGPVVDESGEAKTATMEFEFELFRRQGDDELSVWKATVDAELRKRDGEWRFIRTRTSTVDGRMPR